MNKKTIKKSPSPKSEEDYLQSISESGILTSGSRLKRVADLLISQVQELYTKKNIDFKPHWFPILLALKHSQKLDSKSLAERRKVTPSAISQILKEMEKNKLIEIKSQKIDQRQKLITITSKGQKIITEIIPCLKIVEKALLDILGDKVEIFLQTLEDLENQLNEKPFYYRDSLGSKELKIEKYKKEYRDFFDKLNRAWLEKYFVVEVSDDKILKNPEKHILKKGGQIFFALQGGSPIATLALIKHSPDKVEIAKMAVDEEYQRKGVGTKLFEESLNYIKSQGYKEIEIFCDTKLTAAMALYKKFGFKQISSKTPYKHRGNIVLKKSLI